MNNKNAPIGHEEQAELTTHTEAIRRAPAVDIYENTDEILLVTDMPGVPREALNVRLDGSDLLVEGTQPAPDHEGHHVPALFHRLFRVPETIDADRIHAQLDRGVLTVRLAKAEAAKPRRIEVKTA